MGGRRTQALWLLSTLLYAGCEGQKATPPGIKPYWVKQYNIEPGKEVGPSDVNVKPGPDVAACVYVKWRQVGDAPYSPLGLLTSVEDAEGSFHRVLGARQVGDCIMYEIPHGVVARQGMAYLVFQRSTPDGSVVARIPLEPLPSPRLAISPKEPRAKSFPWRVLKTPDGKYVGIRAALPSGAFSFASVVRSSFQGMARNQSFSVNWKTGDGAWTINLGPGTSDVEIEEQVYVVERWTDHATMKGIVLREDWGVPYLFVPKEIVVDAPKGVRIRVPAQDHRPKSKPRSKSRVVQLDLNLTLQSINDLKHSSLISSVAIKLQNAEPQLGHLGLSGLRILRSGAGSLVDPPTFRYSAGNLVPSVLPALTLHFEVTAYREVERRKGIVSVQDQRAQVN